MSENTLENWSRAIDNIAKEDLRKRKEAKNKFQELMKDHVISDNLVSVLNMCADRQAFMIKFGIMGSGRSIEEAKYAAEEIKRIDSILEDLIKE